MKFEILSEVLEEIRKSSSRIVITEQLAALFNTASGNDIRIMVYLLLGELRPSYKGATIFGIAERSLAPIVAEMLHMSESEVQHTLRRHADLGELMVQGTWHARASLTLKQVYEHLEEIEGISGDKAQALRAKKLAELFHLLRPVEAALVARIVLGKLRLGFSDMTIVDALSWMVAGNKFHRPLIEKAYNVTADLGVIAQQIKEKGVDSLVDQQPKVGIPVRPAAAERLESAQEIFDKLGSCVIQPKIDGFRLQVHVLHHGHKRDPDVFFFSRNLQRMDGMFPELEAAMKTYPGNIIVEGEAVAYDEATDSYFSFQETVRRKRKYDIAAAAAEYPLKLMLFDIMVADDTPCMTEPHHARFKLLAATVKKLSVEARGVVSIIPEIKVASPYDIESYFLEQIDRGFEGIMAKRDTVAYQAGKRNFGWIKLKRQEIGKLEDTIDAVVLGYYPGRGKRSKFGIGAFLIGVYDQTKDVFETIAKVGTGLSDQEWVDLKRMCDTYAVDTQPRNVICSKLLAPAVWVEPHIVIEVAADEMSKSPVHSAGWTKEGYGFALRFPRMVKMRADKSIQDATTVKELEGLYRGQQRSKK